MEKRACPQLQGLSLAGTELPTALQGLVFSWLDLSDVHSLLLVSRGLKCSTARAAPQIVVAVVDAVSVHFALKHCVRLQKIIWWAAKRHDHLLAALLRRNAQTLTWLDTGTVEAKSDVLPAVARCQRLRTLRTRLSLSSEEVRGLAEACPDIEDVEILYVSDRKAILQAPWQLRSLHLYLLDVDDAFIQLLSTKTTLTSVAIYAAMGFQDIRVPLFACLARLPNLSRIQFGSYSASLVTKQQQQQQQAGREDMMVFRSLETFTSSAQLSHLPPFSAPALTTLQCRGRVGVPAHSLMERFPNLTDVQMEADGRLFASRQEELACLSLVSSRGAWRRMRALKLKLPRLSFVIELAAAGMNELAELHLSVTEAAAADVRGLLLALPRLEVFALKDIERAERGRGSAVTEQSQQTVPVAHQRLLELSLQGSRLTVPVVGSLQSAFEGLLFPRLRTLRLTNLAAPLNLAPLLLASGSEGKGVELIMKQCPSVTLRTAGGDAPTMPKLRSVDTSDCPVHVTDRLKRLQRTE